MTNPRTRRLRSWRRSGVLLLVPLLGLTASCTDLDENPVASITPENFYQTPEEVIGGLAAVYAELRGTLWAYYNLSEISSDEMVVPTRGSDWFDNGRWLEIHRHTWSANSPSALDDINGAWNNLFSGVTRANVLLNALENVTVPDQEAVEAEIRVLRAFYYYGLMDLFGGVPIVTDTEVMPRERNSRAEVFQFIESELNAARGALPEQWPPNMHGRVTQGAADAILASIYLNAEVFSGTARWQDAIDAADRVINSGVYSLAEEWRSNFLADNNTSPENIFMVKHLNEVGLGLNFVMRALHYNHISPTPWNGFSTLSETYNTFDLDDDQRTEIFLVGPQVNLETGEPITDRAGNPLNITPEIGDVTAAGEHEGARIVKWALDPEHLAENNSNDMAYFRLGEMYLIKAEALNELGMIGPAVDQINIVRERVFEPDEPLDAGSFDQASLRDRILDERLFELTAEAKRRQDLIRHGRFTDPWQFKEAGAPHLVLFPIPQTQLDTNPLLVQNTGY